MQAFSIGKKSLLALIMLCFTAWIQAQQLDQIGKKEAVKVNGGLNVNQVYRGNASSGIDPYAIVLSGNVTTSLYGMSIPLTFSWSNNEWTYTQPFNQFALSPSYKWATAHIGWSSMSFSPYSLNGHSFAGAGVELSPGSKFKFSAMYGQLLKAAVGDSTAGYLPRYRRMGGGAKASYNFEFGEIGVHWFTAADELSKPVDDIDSLGVTPMENTVIGTSFNVRPMRGVAVRGEVSMSSLSTDRRISKATDLDGTATNRYHAAKTDISWSNRLGSVGAGIEYVEPGYNSLGSYYMVNDFINYTFNLATAILNGKVTFAGSIGLRETNLNDQSATDQRDVVQNLNIGFVPSDKLSFTASYSNFYNYSFVRPLFDETNTHTEYELLDTLRFTQINENISLNSNWKIKESEQRKQHLNLGLTYQQASQNQSDAVENANSSFINGSGGYQISWTASEWSLGINANYSQNKMPESTSEAYGPLLSVRKSMLDKTLRHQLSVSWNGTYVDNVKNGDVLTARLGSNYTIQKKHRFNLSIAWSQRQRSTGATTSYTTATLGYSYNFGWPKSEASK